MQVVLNVKGSFRTTGSSHNREVVALYRWPLVQVPLYCVKSVLGLRVHTYLFLHAFDVFFAILLQLSITSLIK